jgi:hypothetical protein
MQNSNITIRRLGRTDTPHLEELAALDASEAPAAPVLGAEVEGRLLAAISLESGAMISDPFSRTAELQDLLVLRAGQLKERERPARGRILRRRSASAPAPAGQLVGLHPRAS